MREIPLRAPALLLGVALPGGCASFSPGGGLGGVNAITRDRMDVAPRPAHTEADRARVADEVQWLLAEPLDADRAVKPAGQHGHHHP